MLLFKWMNKYWNFSIICVINKGRDHIDFWVSQELGFNEKELIRRVRVLTWRLTGLKHYEMW